MKLNPFVIMREEFDGTGMVFNPVSNHVTTLNSSGVVLWKAIENGSNFSDMVEAILARYKNVSEKQAEADVRKFVELLKAKDLLAQTDDE